jgi:hypothetical protein
MATILTQFEVPEATSGDMDLVHACKNGDAAAFEQLGKQYGNTRSFDWFLIGEKENRERGPAENPPPQNTIVRN